MSEESFHTSSEDLPLNDIESLHQEWSSRLAEHSTGILSLPNELLVRIFGTLKDKELYSHIRTCRTFHVLSIHVLLQRHSNKHSSSGRIHIHNSPTFILPAIHGALFLDLHDISILFASHIFRFLTEARILTEIIERMTQNTRLSLNMKRVGTSSDILLFNGNVSKLVKALQGLMDAALKKGCTTLCVFSTAAFRKILVSTKSEARGQPEKEPKPDRLSGFVHQLRNMFTKSRPPKLREEVPDDANLSAAASASSNIGNDIVPIFPSHLDVFPATTTSTRDASITVSLPLLFANFFLDWTLSLFNYGSFTKLVLLTTQFGADIWHDILPRIRMDNLKHFSFSGDHIQPYDLLLFLQRHSGTLEYISLDLGRSYYPHSSWMPPSYNIVHAEITAATSRFHPPGHPEPPLHPPYSDFSDLQLLSLNSRHIPWFLDSITSDTKSTQYLPNLSDFTIKLLPDDPELDEVFESILKLTNLENPGYRCPDWLSYLRVNAKSVTAPSFHASLGAYIEKHSTDTGTVFTPKVSFPTIHKLRLGFQSMSADLDILNLIRRFLAFFPNMRHLQFGSIGRDTLKKRRGLYWQDVRVHCPKLEVVVFDGFRDPQRRWTTWLGGYIRFDNMCCLAPARIV
ncbi:hypothetical protein BDN72DRAFT_856552 [Pluteus cervinus]|uniref:Uncharacterized protein n=1 Tax=Pluteus cervinus TaxID=181527 RepID=A0ACD3AYU6_9AGAR|nr:hypothetical protein BDN72DRAFT_856552 [Pluteus cervinus]